MVRIRNKKASHHGLKSADDPEDITSQDAKGLLDYDSKINNGAIETALNRYLGKQDPEDTRKLLGRGGYGAAFALPDDRVIKVDSTDSESDLLGHIKRHPLLSAQKVTPVVNKVTKVPVGRGKLSIIDREDLSDLPGRFTGYTRRLSKALENYLDRSERPAGTFTYLKDLSPRSARKILHNRLSNAYKDTILKDPLSDKEKANVKKHISGVRRLIHHGIVPDDIAQQNMGIRKNGEIVFRDNGMYSIINDPEHTKYQHNIRKQLETLRNRH